MQRTILKQVLFLIFVAVVLVLLMGLIIFSSAKAETKSESPAKTRMMVRSPAVRVFERDDENWDSKKKSNNLSGESRYNRVEGFYLGVGLNQDKQRFPENKANNRPFLYGFSGYAFSLKAFEYQIGIEKGFFGANRFALGVEHHETVDTPDRWIISDHENSLAAFFLKEDFRDYYFAEGSSGTISQNFTPSFKMTLGYEQEDWTPETRNSKWSLFGGHKRFRENPAMAEGEVRSLVGKVVLDTRNSPKKTTRGLYVQLEGEYAGRDLGGDYQFNRFLADARWYWTLDSWEGLDFRFRGGTSYGNLPWQKTYHLGGISTLRGFAYKAFPDGPMQPGGNRMALVQVEYRAGSEEFPYGLDLGFLRHFNLIFFSDAGWVGQVGSRLDPWEGFTGLSFKTMKNDVGIALANRSGSMRFEVARRTDTGEKPFTFYFRIERPF